MPIDKNFAAGMSGGIAYVLENKELVLMEKVDSKLEQEELKRIIEEHVKATNSGYFL